MKKTRPKDKSKIFFLLISLGSMFILYGLFYIFPIGYGIVGSFTNWQPLTGEFSPVGFDNYAWLFKNAAFWSALKNTLIFTLACVILTTSLGLGLAMLVSCIKKLQGFFKSVIYLPYITSIITIGVVWRWIFSSDSYGLLNTFLSFFGEQGMKWLLDPALVMPCMIAMTVWHDIGFALILFLAGLAEIPQQLYEAASIDGANKFQTFRKITLPMLAPTTSLVAVSCIITYIQVYDQVKALTASQNSPVSTAITSTFFLFEKVASGFKYGRASAAAVVMLGIIMGLSLLQMKLSNQKNY